MLGTGQQHWPTVHAADLADFFRRVHDADKAQLAEARQHLAAVMQGTMGNSPSAR